MLDGFDELLEHSRDRLREQLTAKLSNHATQMLSAYSKEELHAARLYYNTRHLVGYWRYYRQCVDDAILNGRIPASFPLITADSDTISRRITLSKFNARKLFDGIFIPTSRGQGRSSFVRSEMTLGQLQDLNPDARVVLDSLDGRLSLVVKHFRETSAILYRLFLSDERRKGSELWDAYRIHLFLDTFMYRCDNGYVRSSRFDFIFFANNRLELMIWLEACLQNGESLSLKKAEQFLTRQTRYYLGLSQTIRLDENEVLNRHKELLYYDPVQRITRLRTVDLEILEACRAAIKDLGTNSQGCPFARVKGAKTNALTEVYQYLDRLFLFVLGNSWEFKRLMRSEKCVLDRSLTTDSQR